MFALFLAVALFGSALCAPPDDQNCGTTPIKPSLGNRIEGRIVGGKEAVRNSWPWQVQIRYNGGHFCGASLLSEDWIISAAHCFKGFSSKSYSFHLGRHSKSGSSEPFEQKTYPKSIIMHESYDSTTTNNDVAIISLSSAIKYTDQVQPVCLPTTTSELPEGTDVHVTGWGDVKGTCCSTVLKQVMVPIIGRTKCNQKDYYGGAITGGMICAGLENGGRDSCQGDSGGPLVAQNGANGKWELYGIVSWGYGCASAKKPGVYSNVHYYRNWIRSKVTMVEQEMRLVNETFRPTPSGSAFREAARKLVQMGQVTKSELPGAGEWMQ